MTSYLCKIKLYLIPYECLYLPVTVINPITCHNIPSIFTLNVYLLILHRINLKLDLLFYPFNCILMDKITKGVILLSIYTIIKKTPKVNMKHKIPKHSHRLNHFIPIQKAKVMGPVKVVRWPIYFTYLLLHTLRGLSMGL